MGTRPPTVGIEGWYPVDADRLDNKLEEYLGLVPDTVDSSTLPAPGARIIVAPHASYTYSGKCAAWSYKALDLRHAKRVFVIGPTHKYGFDGVHFSTFDKYATPFGDLTVDQETTKQLKEIGKRSGVRTGDMRRSGEEKEHNLEMQMPYLYKRCQQTFQNAEQFPVIVPVLIGMPSHASDDLNTKEKFKAREIDEQEHKEKERLIARLLVPYLRDKSNVFIISSDFCHWSSSYFGYAPYSAKKDVHDWVDLKPWDKTPRGPPIHETIQLFDQHAMDAVESGSHDAFCESIKLTGNSVCGKHPIGIMLAALDQVAKEDSEAQPRVKILRYDRSSLVTEANGHSVSYVAAYAVL